MDPTSNQPGRPQDTTTPPQPVAYDQQGRPLYAAPPTQPQTEEQQEPQFVHFSRAIEPVSPPVSAEIKTKHEESTRLYPQLNLSEAEFVISAVRRHPIGLFIPVGFTIFAVALVASLMVNFSLIMQSFGVYDPPSYGSVILIGILLILLFLVGGYIAVWVYINNKFFLTNESVIQEIQTSLFSRHEQTVSLANIEDASFRQQGILQMLFNYGSIRLSTEGDETTYRFQYVSDPKEQIAILNNAVEAFKNGRPLSE